MRHIVLVSTCLAVMLLALPSAEAGKKGSLYVASYIDPGTASKKDGTQHATVYVYTPTGAQVSSGKGGGGWLPGQEIPLAPGEYWVAIGKKESPYNLHHYTVVEGKATVVETGWVSVATLPLAEQPMQDCAQWTATLRAYIPVDGKLQAIIANDDRKPDEFGSIQLHPGDYVVEFNRLEVPITVEAGKDYRIPTGFVGPSNAPEAYIVANEDDEPRKTGVPVCTDGAMHVVAGDYWMQELSIRADGQEVSYKTSKIEVPAEGNQGYSSLGTDRPANVKPADSTDGERISPEAAVALKEWGKKQTEFDDLNMFGTDPL